MKTSAAASRRILILAPFPPGRLQAHGGAVAIAALVEGLSRRHHVALAYQRADDESSADPSLADGCDLIVEGRRQGVSVSTIRPLRRLPRMLPRVASGHPLWVASRWSAAFARDVSRVAREWRPDIVQAEFGVMGMYLSAAGARARTVVTLHDPGTASAREQAARADWPAWPLWWAEAQLWRRYERRLLERADAVVTFTKRDQAPLAPFDRRGTLTTIPLGVTIPPDPADPIGGHPPLLLFVANFNHPPNVDAARHLLEDVYPLVRARTPGVELAIVGGHPPGWLLARRDPGLRVSGFVPDLGPIVNAATVVVAPLRQGGGMRVKVLEALASGKAVVGTGLAFEGTGVTTEREALIADDAASFASSIQRLLDNPGLRVALGRAARAHAVASLSWDRTVGRYEAVYDRLLEDGSGPREQAGS